MTQKYKDEQKKKQSKHPNQQLLKAIDNEIKQALKDCWEYNKTDLQNANITKSNLLNDLYNCTFNNWEDIAFFVGYLRGLEQTKELIINEEI